MTHDIQPETKAYSSVPGFVDSKHIKGVDAHAVVLETGGSVVLWRTDTGKRFKCVSVRKARKQMREMAVAS